YNVRQFSKKTHNSRCELNHTTSQPLSEPGFGLPVLVVPTVDDAVAPFLNASELYSLNRHICTIKTTTRADYLLLMLE
ncbi:unnamed protein product, partial [Ceratitis capitata]